MIADATGRHYLITDADPGFTGGEAITTAATDFCFGPGTRLSTPDGYTLVDDLKRGDMVLTQDGASVPVKWIDHQSFIRLSDPSGRRTPVRIAAGALGRGLPEADLFVTADHGLLVEGQLINAWALVNDTTIRFVDRGELPEKVIYCHVETQNHDVILANGVPAETFVDCRDRQAFDNYQEYLDLFGAERIITEMPYPRISSQRLVPETIRRRLGIQSAFDELDALMSA